MSEYFVGAFNFGAPHNLSSDIAIKARSLLPIGKEGATFTKNKSFFLFSSNECAGHSFSDGLIVGAVEQITGYTIKIPYEYNVNTFYTLKYLYNTFGLDFAKYINGHFAIALFDGRNDQLLLIQDKFPGIKTLYWCNDKDFIYFSNYMKPLLIMKPELKRNISQNALFHFSGMPILQHPTQYMKVLHN